MFYSLQPLHNSIVKVHLVSRPYSTQVLIQSLYERRLHSNMAPEPRWAKDPTLQSLDEHRIHSNVAPSLNKPLLGRAFDHMTVLPPMDAMCLLGTRAVGSPRGTLGPHRLHKQEQYNNETYKQQPPKYRPQYNCQVCIIVCHHGWSLTQRATKPIYTVTQRSGRVTLNGVCACATVVTCGVAAWVGYLAVGT